MNVFLDISILSFYISFLGIAGMIGFKALEEKSGKKSFISKLSDLTNHRVHAAQEKLGRFFSYFNRRSALALIELIAYHILSWVRRVYHWLYNKAHSHAPSKKVIDMVRGKVEINKNGGSSFYFKNLMHGKDDEEKREIK